MPPRSGPVRARPPPIPAREGAAAAGDLAPVTAWLRDRIHRHGRMLTPQELLLNACGAPFDPTFYVDYLKKKYGELYSL